MQDSRRLTHFALIQLAMAVTGFFGLGAALQLQGYPDTLSGYRHWHAFPIFFREHGLLLIVLQSAMLVASFGFLRSPRRAETAQTWIEGGLVWSAVFVIACLIGAADAQSRGLILARSAPPQKPAPLSRHLSGYDAPGDSSAAPSAPTAPAPSTPATSAP